MRGQVDNIGTSLEVVNKTIHNGMSHQIRETNEKVARIDARLEKVNAKVEDVIAEGHPGSCLYIKAVAEEKKLDEEKRTARLQGLTRGQKIVVWILSVIATSGAGFATWQSLLNK
jgi:predicted RNase H-like nuclease